MTAEKAKTGPHMIEIDGEKFHAETIVFEGERFTVRELAADEGDDCAEAATDDKGKINERLNTRMLMAKALVEPVKTVEQIGKFGNQKFQLILRTFNRLNSLPITNPTAPAGSAGQTSPSGGEPIPQP